MRRYIFNAEIVAPDNDGTCTGIEIPEAVYKQLTTQDARVQRLGLQWARTALAMDWGISPKDLRIVDWVVDVAEA